jgi:hypothetical protein
MRFKFAVPLATLLTACALPAIADNPGGAHAIATVSLSQERSVRGVVEVIDAGSEKIRLSGADYAFSAAKVRINNKTGKVPSSSLRVGDRVQCVVLDDGITQHVTEVWVES